MGALGVPEHRDAAATPEGGVKSGGVYRWNRHARKFVQSDDPDIDPTQLDSASPSLKDEVTTEDDPAAFESVPEGLTAEKTAGAAPGSTASPEGTLSLALGEPEDSRILGGGASGAGSSGDGRVGHTASRRKPRKKSDWKNIR